MSFMRRELRSVSFLVCSLKQFMSSSEGDGDQEALEDSPYSDMKIDVPRLTEFMKELLQTIESNLCIDGLSFCRCRCATHEFAALCMVSGDARMRADMEDTQLKYRTFRASTFMLFLHSPACHGSSWTATNVAGLCTLVS